MQILNKLDTSVFSAFNPSRLSQLCRLIAVALLVAFSTAPATAGPCGGATPVAAIGHTMAGPLNPGEAHRFLVGLPTRGILGFAIETPIAGPQARLELLDCVSGHVTTIESFEQARTVAVRRPGMIRFEVTADSAVSSYQIRTSFVPTDKVRLLADLRILDPAAAFFATQTPEEPEAVSIRLLAPIHNHGPLPVPIEIAGSDHEDETDNLEIDVLLQPLPAGVERLLVLDVGRAGVLLTEARSNNSNDDGTNILRNPRWLAAVRPGQYMVTVSDSKVSSLHFELLDLCGPGQPDPDSGPACAAAMTAGTESVHDLANSSPTDVDTLSFVVTNKATVTLATLDGLDTLGALYDHDGHRLVVDTGDGSGFVIKGVLEPGIYYLRVEGRVGVTGLYRPILSIDPIIPEK